MLVLACNVSALEAEAKESSGPAWARNSEVWAYRGPVSIFGETGALAQLLSSSSRTPRWRVGA